ncbi:MAG: cell envelope integrity protein TolA [Candidatus Electrothrix scaldis]|nr:MAG: cell envelope integrity protein TolA [Candidatus Electrothrix sp. GW3-3]
MKGLYIGDTWEKFLAQRERLPSWKIPLSIAAVLHLAVFTGAAVFPDVGKKYEQDKVITIDLLSLPPAAPAPLTAQKGESQGEKQGGQSAQAEKPAQVKKIVQAAEQKKIVQKAQPAQVVVKPAPPEPKEQARELPVVVPKKVVLKPAQKKTSPPEPVAEVKSAQVKPVSLNPLKRKKQLAEDIRLAEEKERAEREKARAAKEKKQEQERLAAQQKKEEKKRLAEQRKREQIAAEQQRKLAAQKKKQQEAEAKRKLAAQQRKNRALAEAARLAREAERAAEQARLEAARARNEYAAVSQTVSDLESPLLSSGSNSGGGRSSDRGSNSGSASGRGIYGGYGSEQVNNAALKEYGAKLQERLREFWQIPEIVNAKPNLITSVALTVRRDGTIVGNVQIERGSGDSFFDQSVLKALYSAVPFPGLSGLTDESTQEFTLDFTPEGLAL